MQGVSIMERADRSSSKVIAFRPRAPKTPKPGPGAGDTIEYEETLEVPVWARWGLYAVFALVIGYFLFAPFVTHGESDPIFLLLAIVFALVAWVVHLFLTLKITLTSEGIQFGFYLFSKRIPYAQIVDCSVIRYSLLDFLGWGVRKGPTGITMYNIPGDQQIAVKILVREEDDQRKEYAFSAKRPQVICKKLQSHLAQGPQQKEKKTERKDGTLISSHS